MTNHVLKNVKIYEKHAMGYVTRHGVCDTPWGMWHAMGYVTVFYNTLQIEILCYHKSWNIKGM